MTRLARSPPASDLGARIDAPAHNSEAPPVCQPEVPLYRAEPQAVETGKALLA